MKELRPTNTVSNLTDQWPTQIIPCGDVFVAFTVGNPVFNICCNSISDFVHRMILAFIGCGICFAFNSRPFVFAILPTMQIQMLSARHQLQIGKSVISTIVVAMMHNFIRGKQSTKMLFHNKSMLITSYVSRKANAFIFIHAGIIPQHSNPCNLLGVCC